MSPTLFTLTGLTGRRAREQRIIPFASFEATPRTWASLVAAAGTFLLLTLIGWGLIGAPAVLLGGLAGCGVFAALNVRSRRGTKRLWVVTQMDRRRSAVGSFFLCGLQVDPDQADLVLFSRSTVPARRSAPNSPVERPAVGVAGW